MNVRKEKKAAFSVVGFMKELELSNKMENYIEIGKMWENLSLDMISQLKSETNSSINAFVGVSDEKGQKHFNYLIGVCSTDAKKFNGLSTIVYPEVDWLVFNCIGSIPDGAMINLKREVLIEWLPNSDYEQLSLPRLEAYFDGDLSSDTYNSEFWIPVKNKVVSK